MFARRFRELRTAHHLTQKEIADRLGVTKSIISFYENGDRYPSFDILIKVARIFHVSTDYLLGVEPLKTLDISELRSEDVSLISSLIDRLKEKRSVV